MTMTNELLIAVEMVRWDDSLESYEKLRFLVAPQGIVRNPQNRAQLLLGAVDTKEVNIGDWVVQLPGRLNLVLKDRDVIPFIKQRRN